MAWETIAQIYRAQGTAYGTTYWDIDTNTTELNDDFTKYVTVQFNGQTLYVTKSAVYDFESYGGAIILVVKDTTNSGYIRERLIHSQSSYNYTTLLTPNYTENGLKVYIKSLSPEHLPNVQIPVTSNAGGSSMTTNISIFSDRITRVYTYQDYMALMELSKVTSNGGGATHIAKVTGQLKDLSSNLSDILMVSGGGGGGLLVGDTDYSGKEAGGISGSGDNSADQSTGNAFGQGESGTNVSGGGSGLYGGYKGTSSKSGGAGSGYIGNSLLSNKKMVGYNVPTSSAEGTKTESVNEVSASAVGGKPKSGNGFARIKFLRDFEPPEEYRQYIDNINGSGFDFIKNLQAQTFTGTFNGVTKTFPNMQYEPKTLSWYSYSHTGTDVPWQTSYFAGLTTALFCSTTIDKVYITSNNGTYTCTITKDNNSDSSTNWSYTYNIGLYNGIISGVDNPRYYLYGNFNDSLDYIDNHNCNPWYNGSWATKTFTGTLDQVFQELQKYARNIDIYVDGILWSKAGL